MVIAAPFPLQDNYEGTPPLSNSQYQLLQEADADGSYSARLFHKVVNGQDRYCALVGETHFKFTDSSAKISQSLAREFRYYGLEGLDPYQYWGNDFWETAELVIAAPFLIVSLLLSVALFSEEEFSADSVDKRFSTIFLIEDLHGRDPFAYPDLLQTLAHRYRLRAMTPETQAKVTIALRQDEKKKYIYDDKQDDPIVKIMPKFDRLPREVNGREIMSALEIGNSHQLFSLEEGRKPSVYNQFGKIMGDVLFISASVIGGAYCLRHRSKLASSLLFGVAKFSPAALFFPAVWILGSIAATFLSPQYRSLSKFIAPSAGDLIYARNDTMAFNINRILEQQKEDEPFVAIVGDGHTKDLAFLLENTYHFQEIPLRADAN